MVSPLKLSVFFTIGEKSLVHGSQFTYISKHMEENLHWPIVSG